MRLSDVAIATLEESRFALICEKDEAPRWQFDYDNATKDPNPDILLLGAYRHPTTGNNLVGGINLNYLDERQRDKLASTLPKIMQGKNLKDRYWIGRKTVPDVFHKFYRTYNPKFIRGVETDVLYPKYGLLKTTKQWVKKKLANIFKSKAQRQKELEPEYPDDLETMQDRLNQAVRRLQQQPEVQQEPTEPEPEELARARDEFEKQKEKTEKEIERQEDLPLKQAQQDREQEQRQQEKQVNALRELEKEREQTQRELLDPANEIDLDRAAPQSEVRQPEEPEIDEIEPEEDEELKSAFESIISYYSPVAGHTIFEPYDTAITHDNYPLIFLEGWGNEKTLSGEYWLAEGDALYAENDYDHTMHVIDVARQSIGEEFDFDAYDEFIDWEEFKNYLATEHPELRSEIYMTHAGPRPQLQELLFQNGINLELWDVANWMGEVEPRLYAAKNWGWVRNEGNNLEAYEISRSKLREIAQGLDSAYGDADLERQAFDIYVYNTKKFYREVPFDVIESGDMASLRDYG